MGGSVAPFKQATFLASIGYFTPDGVCYLLLVSFAQKLLSASAGTFSSEAGVTYFLLIMLILLKLFSDICMILEK